MNLTPEDIKGLRRLLNEATVGFLHIRHSICGGAGWSILRAPTPTNHVTKIVAWGVGHAEDARLFCALHSAAPALLDAADALATVTRERDEARETAVEFHRRLTTRPLAVCAYCATPMPETDPTGARSEERMAWMDTHMRTCPEHPMSAVTRERDELRAVLLNERGEGEPPSGGWAWRETCWTRDLPSGEQARVSWDATGLDTELPRWRCWLENAEDYAGYFIVPSAPTARDAMKAADAALAGGKS